MRKRPIVTIYVVTLTNWKNATGFKLLAFEAKATKDGWEVPSRPRELGGRLRVTAFDGAATTKNKALAIFRKRAEGRVATYSRQYWEAKRVLDAFQSWGKPGLSLIKGGGA